MQTTLFDTYYGQGYSLMSLARKASNDLHTTLVPDHDQEQYQAIVRRLSAVTQTPMSAAFEAAQRAGVIEHTCLLSFFNNTNSLPEALSIRDLAIYGKQTGKISKPYLNGVWIDLTTLASRPKERGGLINITGVNETMASIVRGGLVMGYADNDTWINDRSASFLCGLYAKTMTKILDRFAHLDLEEGSLVRYAYAYYFASRCSNRRSSDGLVELINRVADEILSGTAKIDTLNERMLSITKGQEPTIQHVGEFISTYGPDRLRKFEGVFTYRELLSSARNSITTAIAADFPPYFAYLVLRCASNDKHPLLTMVLNSYNRTLLDRELTVLAQDRNCFGGIKF